MAKAFWIDTAIKKPGALRNSLKIKKGKKISVSALKMASRKKGKMGKRARLAMTLKSFNKGRSGGRTL